MQNSAVRLPDKFSCENSQSEFVAKKNNHEKYKWKWMIKQKNFISD